MPDVLPASAPILPRAEDIAAVTARPGYPAALRAFCEGVVEMFEGNSILNVIASDRARMVMGWMAFYLDAGYRPSDPQSGLTVARYKALCASTGLCSAPRAAAMLGLMRFGGYVEPAERTHRDQPVRLVPTEKFKGPQRERLRRVFTAMSHIGPEGPIALARLNDPEFVKAFVLAASGRFVAGQRPIDHGPDLRLFSETKAGLLILMQLMLTANEPLPPTGLMSMPVAALAQRFSLSRGNVKDLLLNAVAAGLLTPSAIDGSAYRITPRLRTSILGFTGAMFHVMAESIAEADAASRRRTGVAEDAV